MPAPVSERESHLEVDRAARRLLVVQDPDSPIRFVREYLSRTGTKARVCESEREALKLIEESGGQFTDIVADITIGQDLRAGLRIARSVKEHFPDVRFVGILAMDDNLLETEAGAERVDHVIRRPLTAKDFVTQFERLVSQIPGAKPGI